jgi:dipeptidyl aminopeptidase/acylaminoacyl peptidase
MQFRSLLRAAVAAWALSASLPAATPAAAIGVHPAPARVERGALMLDGIPEGPGPETRLSDYLQSRKASFLDWLADGSLLISTRFGDSEQLHRVQAPLAAREQLTFATDPVRSAAANPFDTDTFLFLKDHGGDENAQIYLRRTASGAMRRLGDGHSRYGLPVWANDGKHFAFQSNQRNGVDYDVFVADATSDDPPRLVAGGGRQTLSVLDWSFDDARLLVLKEVSAVESYLYVADLKTGSLTLVEPLAALPSPAKPGKRGHAHAAPPLATPHYAVTTARFSRDGRGIYFVSTHGGEFAELRYLDLYTKEGLSVAPQEHSDVEELALSRDGRYLAYTLNEGGLSRLVVHDLLQRADLLLPPLPNGAVITGLGFDPSGRRLALGIETAQAPRDVFVVDLAGTPQLIRWTRSEIGPVDASGLVPAIGFSFPTWDRVGTAFRQVPAFIYRPRTPGPHPVFIEIHGGPESQYRPTWNPFTQFLVDELGYAVIAPNVRGSSGYGLGYLALDDGPLREDAVRDIGSLLVWIGLQTDLDRGRVVVSGGSYGGYMALASLAKYGDRLAGGIDVVGISNFVTFLEHTSPYRRDLRRAEYGDERDPAMRALLQRISPLTNAALIRKPLLVVQGLNDPRVPASESEQMVARIRANGGEAWYLAARDEGHGFRKKPNRDAYLQTAVQFLQQLAPR